MSPCLCLAPLIDVDGWAAETSLRCGTGSENHTCMPRCLGAPGPFTGTCHSKAGGEAARCAGWTSPAFFPGFSKLSPFHKLFIEHGAFYLLFRS